MLRADNSTLLSKASTMNNTFLESSKLLITFFNSLVLGASKLNASNTANSLSFAFADNAERNAKRRIFLGILRSEERRVGNVTGVQTCALPILLRADNSTLLSKASTMNNTFLESSKLLITFFNSLVLGASKLNASNTANSLSFAFADNAERNAKRRIFLGIL